MMIDLPRAMKLFMMSDAAGMSEQLISYQWLALILSMLGFTFGYLIDNLLAAVGSIMVYLCSSILYHVLPSSLDLGHINII